MAAPISTTETQLFALLRAFILPLVDTGVEVVRGQGNRVPMPVGPFVLITAQRGTALGAPVQTYDSSGAQTMNIAQPTEFRIGVDCFGPQAGDYARAISMALRSSYGCDQLPGIAPLYGDDAVQFPLVDGEEQYVERWRFDSVLQYTPSITVGQQSMIAATVGVISVDATYHP